MLLFLVRYLRLGTRLVNAHHVIIDFRAKFFIKIQNQASDTSRQPRTQALSSTLLAGENTLAGAGHVYPKFWVAKSIIAVGGVVEESVCRVWKIATLCFIVSGDKHALLIQQEIVKGTVLNSYLS